MIVALARQQLLQFGRVQRLEVTRFHFAPWVCTTQGTCAPESRAARPPWLVGPPVGFAVPLCLSRSRADLRSYLHRPSPAPSRMEEVEVEIARREEDADDESTRPAPYPPTERDAEAAQRELDAITQSVQALEQQIADEEGQIAEIEATAETAAATLVHAQAQRAGAEAQLNQRKRVQTRQASSAKLLQLQLTVATQLYGVAESLSQVAAASSGSGSGSASKGGRGGRASHTMLPDVLRQRDQEIEELRRALKRQKLLVADAHRQLLEVSTRKRPMGAPRKVSDDVNELRAALAEQEMRRLMAEARADELLVQVRLLEERGLRLRLHPSEPPLLKPASPGSDPSDAPYTPAGSR